MAYSFNNFMVSVVNNLQFYYTRAGEINFDMNFNKCIANLSISLDIEIININYWFSTTPLPARTCL